MRVERRRMLRMMFGARRAVVVPDDGQEAESVSDECVEEESDSEFVESWPEFITRVTHHIDSRMLSFDLEDWIATHRRRKWRFAGRTARCTDGRWSTRMLQWQPSFSGGRSVGRPCTRWDQCIVSLAGEDWCTQALDADLWTLGEEAYVRREDVLESFSRNR